MTPQSHAIERARLCGQYVAITIQADAANVVIGQIMELSFKKKWRFQFSGIDRTIRTPAGGMIRLIELSDDRLRRRAAVLERLRGHSFHYAAFDEATPVWLRDAIALRVRRTDGPVYNGDEWVDPRTIKRDA